MQSPEDTIRRDLAVDDLPEQLADTPNCHHFLQVWQQWRGDGVLPTRAMADPIPLGATLRAMNIFEVPKPDQIIFRLAATDLEEFTGRNRKGQNLVDLAAPEDRAERIARHQNILNTPCGLLLVRHSTTTSDVPLSMSALLLPVTEAKGTPPRYIYVAMDFAHTDKWLDGEMPTMLELAGTISYVDIGCGLPEQP